MEGIKTQWVIGSPWCYIAAVLIAAAMIRVFLSAIRSLKQAHERNGSWAIYLRMMRLNLRGLHPKTEDGKPSPYSDYWYTFILGALELAAYPILIVMNAWIVIGAWIGLKALAQWEVWAKDRATFNLFLIGNALNVFVAFLFLTKFVTAS
jgi:hypothetical protein